MQIVVNLQTVASSLGNYSGLIASIVDTLKDDSLEDRIPDFVRLAEARFNRLLYPIDDETTATLEATVANEGKVDFPTRFKRARKLSYSGNGHYRTLEQLSPEDFSRRFLGPQTGEPEAFAIAENKFLIGPTPDGTYSLDLTYVVGFTNLSQTNQTNWLIEAHPDLYFFGALVYAELDGWNDERAHDFDGAVDRIIEEIKFADVQRRRGVTIAEVPGVYF